MLMILMSPNGSHIATTPVAATIESDTGESAALQWDYDDEHGRMYVTLPSDQ